MCLSPLRDATRVAGLPRAAHFTAAGRAGLRLAVAVSLIASGVMASGIAPAALPTRAPQTLQETALYADFASLQVKPEHLSFSPQYPLWTDGAAKRRWMSLPPGAAIDASDPDAWVFPVGTRFWKEFSFNGQRVETRYMERLADGRWLYAAYAWSADARETQLVSDQGQRGAYPLGGRRSHAIPSVNDCKACHQGGRAEVLGFSALQLSPDRDSGALHADATTAVDLLSLVDRGFVVGLPKTLIARPPRIDAQSATERAALGYLHGNCGHCHNEQGPLRNVGLFLRNGDAIASTFGHPVKKPAPGLTPDAVLRIEPRNPDRSALVQRIASRYPPLQMPPLGTALADKEAVELLRRWIAQRERVSSVTPQEEKGP